MKLNGEVYFFGDLAQLTAAASCTKPVIVGTDVCDPWGRLYNQNSEVGEFFRFLHFTNVQFLGFLSILLLAIFLLFTVKFLKIESLGIYIMLLTPVMVLAVDRGNELISILFILVGIFCLRDGRQFMQLLGAAALGFAAFFKLWPIFLVFFLLVLQWSRIRIAAKVLLGLPVIYWLLKIPEVEAILKATQVGSSVGTSFGLRLFSSPNFSVTYFSVLVSIALGLTYLLIKLGNQNLQKFTMSVSGMRAVAWIIPLMLTYTAIWATGDNFIYRMLILLPIILLLSEPKIFELDWSKFVVAAILTTAITSRLPVTLAVSSAIALYFLYVSVIALIKGTSGLHK